MNPANPADSHNGAPSSILAELVDRLTARVQAGEPIDWQEVARQHPQHIGELRQLWPALGALEELSQSGPEDLSGIAPAAAQDGWVGGVLGDFRIEREVGRGGMGVVYQAEQISLRRQVALKVLPLAATMDARRLQRFLNEARAAASLHHTNIVPVHFVGSERGVHYYAMQFIEGRDLASVIAQLRAQAAGKVADSPTVPTVDADEGEPVAPTALAAADTRPIAGLSTERSAKTVEYFRTVARLGIQAAEALDHAHQTGIVHRDVKPANLLVDATGRLWVTDFGLAQLQTDTGLTMTGDLVGTLRYMSPEQALAKRVVVDHRTDVYSLGATLYELLTLQPAFDSRDRHELLRQVAFEEPKPLRRINRAVPAELETIVLKAMEKNPADRYATAHEVADDLRRWLMNEPIRARRPTVIRWAQKWAARHRALVGAAALVLLLAVAMLAGTVGWVASDRAARRRATEPVVTQALDESASWQEKRRLPEALSAARRAAGLVAGGEADQALRRRVQARVDDLELLARLEEARLEGTAVRDGHFDRARCERRYGEIFREANLDVEDLPVEQATERLCGLSVAVELAAVLDEWAMFRRLFQPPDDASWKHLLRVARAADPDGWRTRLREALAGRNRKALVELASSDQAADLLPPTLAALGMAIENSRAIDEAVPLLRKAQRLHPDDFWINESLGLALRASNPPQHGEAIPFLMVAVALRPQSPGAHVNLGDALRNKGDVDGAIAAFRKAIELKPDYAEAYSNLGNALWAQKKLAEAEAACRKAIELKPDYPEAYISLGNVLSDQKKLAEAEAACRKAIELKPDLAEPYTNLGNALHGQKKLPEAEAAYRKAIELKPDSATAYFNLGLALRDQGKLAEAEAAFRKAIAIDPRLALAHGALGLALLQQGQFTQAEASTRRARGLLPPDHPLRPKVSQQLNHCRHWLALEKKLPDVLAGKLQPANGAERAEYAMICVLTKRFAASARLFTEAFADPKLANNLQAYLRYNAACAAALAGCGQGKDAADLDAKERERLRQQALTWLRADLAVRQRQLKSWWPGQANEARAALSHWQKDADFAGLRGAEAIGKLPEAERQAWQKLWSDVAEALTTAQKKAAPDKKPDKK